MVSLVFKIRYQNCVYLYLYISCFEIESCVVREKLIPRIFRDEKVLSEYVLRYPILDFITFQSECFVDSLSALQSESTI